MNPGPFSRRFVDTVLACLILPPFRHQGARCCTDSGQYRRVSVRLLAPVLPTKVPWFRTAAQACFVFASDDLFYGITVNVRPRPRQTIITFIANRHLLQPGNAIFTLLASQLIGYGFAGMFRKPHTHYLLLSRGIHP